MGLTYQTIIYFLDNITEVIRNYPKANPLNPYTYSNCINLLLKIENQNYKRNIDFNNANINLSRSGLTNIKSLSYLTFIFDNQKTFISSLILDLSNNEIIDISAFKFLGEVNIDMLVLDNNYLENIDALRGLRINKISIKNNKLSGVFNFSGFERLLSLNLTKNTLNEFIISDFYKSNSTIDGYKLQTLNISMNKFTSIDFVAGLKKLKFFNFSNNKINVLTPLFYHKALTNVSLKNNVFGENDINELKRKNPSILIESLWIYQRISINNTQERIWEKIVSADSFGLWNSIPFYSKIWFNIPEKDTIIDVDYDAHIKVINNSEKKKIIQFKLLSREWSFEQREPDIELQVSLSLDNKNKATYVNIKFGDFLDIPNGEIFYQHYEKEVIESLQRLKTIVE